MRKQHEQQVQRKTTRWRLPRPRFALAGCSLRLPQNTRFVWIQCAFPCFLSGEEGGGRRFFVNEGERAGGREAARGLAAGVSFGLQYAE